MRVLLWISTISIKHCLKSISRFGHKEKLNKQFYISSYTLFFWLLWYFEKFHVCLMDGSLFNDNR